MARKYSGFNVGSMHCVLIVFSASNLLYCWLLLFIGDIFPDFSARKPNINPTSADTIRCTWWCDGIIFFYSQMDWFPDIFQTCWKISVSIFQDMVANDLWEQCDWCRIVLCVVWCERLISIAVFWNQYISRLPSLHPKTNIFARLLSLMYFLLMCIRLVRDTQ